MVLEVPSPKMSFKERTGPCRKDLVNATLETNMLNVDYSDRSVTVRVLLNGIGKSYGTVYVCIWEHLNMKTVSARCVLCL